MSNETCVAGMVWPQKGVVGATSEVMGAGACSSCGVRAECMTPHPHPVTSYPHHPSLLYQRTFWGAVHSLPLLPTFWTLVLDVFNTHVDKASNDGAYSSRSPSLRCPLPPLQSGTLNLDPDIAWKLPHETFLLNTFPAPSSRELFVEPSRPPGCWYGPLSFYLFLWSVFLVCSGQTQT